MIRSLSPTSIPGEVVASVRGVRVERSGRAVLTIDELDLHRGESLAIMGRNGAGKTTLLRTIAGLITPAAGAISGRMHANRNGLYKHLAFVPQDPAAALYKQSVEAEIRDVLAGTGRSGSIDEALAEWQLEALRLADPSDLSVGQRQRVALAAMLAGDPELILLDEPTRGMDSESKFLLVQNLRSRSRAGACVVLASHDVELVAMFAARCVLLAEGQVVTDEPARKALAGSVTFSTQANKLFGGDVLTVEDAIEHARAGVT